jgi:hypothetical protein
MKRREVTDAALKAAGRRSTKASAHLEGREVPDEHVRSAAVERYLADLAAQRQIAGLLHVLRTEIWPLLADPLPAARAGAARLKGRLP